MNRLPTEPDLPTEPARVTRADVKGAAAESWPVIVGAWALGGVTIFLTWNGSLFG